MNIEVKCIACGTKLQLDWPEEDGEICYSVLMDLSANVLKALFDHHRDTRLNPSDPDVRDALEQTHSGGHVRYKFISGVSAIIMDENEIEVHGLGATIK